MNDTNGWQANVQRDDLSLAVRIMLGRPTGDGFLYVTRIAARGVGFDDSTTTTLVQDGHAAPAEASLRLDENAARALYDALAQHFAGEAGGRQTRADLIHERGRVDKLHDALIAIATRGH